LWFLQLDRLVAKSPVAVLDELHKYSKWKSLLKGFFDTYGDRVHLIVTGSSRLDVFRRGSDSLMGHYLLYRMHPWSVGESLRTDLPPREIQPLAELTSAEWDALSEHGGFPEPFLRRDSRFHAPVAFLAARATFTGGPASPTWEPWKR